MEQGVVKIMQFLKDIEKLKAEGLEDKKEDSWTLVVWKRIIETMEALFL